MTNKKNQNGKFLEDSCQKAIHAYKHIRTVEKAKCLECGVDTTGNLDVVYKEYPVLGYKGKFRLRIDFYYKNPVTGLKYYVECKNQEVSGSTDEKIQKYILNALDNRYYGPFFLYINDNFAGRNCYLQMVEETSGMYVIREKQRDEMFKRMFQNLIMIE